MGSTGPAIGARHATGECSVHSWPSVLQGRHGLLAVSDTGPRRLTA